MKFRSLFVIFILIAFSGLKSFAQFPLQVPLTGNTGISQSDDMFMDWASGCSVQRGWLDIANKSLGQATLGADSDAIGFPGGSIVSLGDSGIAVLTFNYNIFNGDGPDFAVFENGFANPLDDTVAYLELAFVEVSSDGVNYFRFPATSNMQDTLQIDNFSYSNCSGYNNLAGKYISGYGTPFDLDELKNIAGLDVNHISHVRLVDVIGSVDSLYGSRDMNNHIINDPYPSPYPSCGFDLSGVGVIHSLKPTTIAGIDKDLSIQVYPNPAENNIHIDCKGLSNVDYRLTDLSGKQIYSGRFSEQTTLSLNNQLQGLYFLYIEQGNHRGVCKIIKK